MMGLLFYLLLAQPGAGQFVWPANLQAVVVQMWAGGGSGGSSNYAWAGGGGGSSAWGLCYVLRPPNGITPYSIGAGGPAVIPGGIGGVAGGDTWFGSCHVYGGGPGYPAGLRNGGEGGYPGVADGFAAPWCLHDANSSPVPQYGGCWLDTVNGGQGQASGGPVVVNGVGYTDGIGFAGANAPLGGIGGNNNQCGQPPGSGGSGTGNSVMSGCGAPGALRIRG